MLYLCPHCGHGQYSLGLAEALAEVAGAVYLLPCLECRTEMRQIKFGEKVYLLPEPVNEVLQLDQEQTL